MTRISNFEELMNLAPDIVDFCRDGKILNAEFVDYGSNIISPFEIVINLADAIRYFGDKSADIEEDFPGYEHFSGLQEREFLRLKIETPHWFSNKVDQLLLKDLNKQLIDSGLGTDIPFLFDGISTTIEFGLCNRIAEQPSKLFTLMLEAFYRGGWPCGWKGRFPDGKLLVFVRG
jgi:hypothetical protein